MTTDKTMRQGERGEPSGAPGAAILGLGAGTGLILLAINFLAVLVWTDFGEDEIKTNPSKGFWLVLIGAGIASAGCALAFRTVARRFGRVPGMRYGVGGFVALSAISLIWIVGFSVFLLLATDVRDSASGVQIFTNYGLGFFLLTPLAGGFLPGVLLAAFYDGRLWEACAAGTFAYLVEILGLLATAQEGVICLFIALPVVLPLTLLGAFLGHRAGMTRFFQLNGAMAGLALLAPGIIGIGGHTPVAWATHTVVTRQIIAAKPAQIWPYLLELKSIPEPTWWLFKEGVAYPVEVSVERPALRARRTCRLSTGPMLETIDVFEPERKLGFLVDSTPPTMTETDPFGKPHPPHLTGTFECIRGEIDLTPLPGGKTLVVGTSVYRQRLAPDAYWSRWCNAIVHHVHLRVFDEIARRVE